MPIFIAKSHDFFAAKPDPPAEDENNPPFLRRKVRHDKFWVCHQKNIVVTRVNGHFPWEEICFCLPIEIGVEPRR